jgi:hypothetical protein
MDRFDSLVSTFTPQSGKDVAALSDAERDNIENFAGSAAAVTGTRRAEAAQP